MIELRINLIDMKWSFDGDFLLENGDIADTSSQAGLGFIQEVKDRVTSSFGDWRLLPGRGSDIDEFHGQINNQNTWENIERAITFSLTSDLFLDKQDFAISIAPITESEIAIRIDFNVSLTGAPPDSTIVLKIIYDLTGKGPFIIR